MADNFSKKCDEYFKGITDENGEYIHPPTLSGLCVHLGMSRDDFADALASKSRGKAAELAKLRIEAFLEEQLFRGKQTSGVMFALTNIYGWSEKGSEARGERLEDILEKLGSERRL